MIDKGTNFFRIEDDFVKTKEISSIPIIESILDFIPKVTIAIPTYKRPELLSESLNSALNQSCYTDYEVIVVDNNPEKGCETEQLLRSYSDKRLSYYKNTENIGMVGNWNMCVDLSKSKWVTILHDDDALHPNFLEYFFKVLELNPRMSAFSCSMFHVGEDVSFTSIYFNQKLQKISKKSFLLGNVSPFPGIVFQKNVNYKFNETLYPIADYDFWYHLACNGLFFKSPMKLAFYRMSNTQVSRSAYKDILKKTKEYRQKYIISKWNLLDKYISNQSLKSIEKFYENQYVNQHKKPSLNFIDLLLKKIYIKIWC